MGKRALALFGLGLAAALCAGERGASALGPPPMLRLKGGTHEVEGPLGAVNIDHSATNGWRVSVTSLAMNGQGYLVCTLSVASAQDAAAIRTQVLSPVTKSVTCFGAHYQYVGPVNQMVALDLTSTTTTDAFDLQGY